MIQTYGCDQKGRRLSWETGVEQVGVEVFPEGYDGGAISCMEGERIPKNKDTVTERNEKSVYYLIYELYGQKWEYEGT